MIGTFTFKVNTPELEKLKARPVQLEHELTWRVQARMDLYGTALTTAMKDQHGRDAHDIQRYVNRTWDLTESIGFTPEPPVDLNDKIVHTLKVFAAAPYAFDVEHGIPGRSRPYPFFWIEIFNDESRSQVLAGLQQDLDNAIAAVTE